jgi:hypothetical protein
MKRTTTTCDKCGKAIEQGNIFTSVSVKTHNTPTLDMIGWSDTDHYHFCFDCHKRDDIRGYLLDLVKVERKGRITQWVKQEDIDEAKAKVSEHNQVCYEIESLDIQGQTSEDCIRLPQKDWRDLPNPLTDSTERVE